MIYTVANGVPRVWAGASSWHGRAATSPRRILIVEDECLMRDFVDRLLRAAGYCTSRVVNGLEALEFAARFGPFDLLLTDLVMPGMNGDELVRQLRRTNSSFKVLYLTGYPDRLLNQPGALMEHDACLDKSATLEELLLTVSRLLEEHRPPSPVVSMREPVLLGRTASQPPKTAGSLADSRTRRSA